MLRVVRGFTERVRQRRRLELALVVVLGLAGLAMGGTGSTAYTNPQHVSPLHRPVEETHRVTRLVAVLSASRQVSLVAVPRPPRQHHPRSIAPTLLPPPSGTPAALPARPRGPPPPSRTRV
jgi:hypothetical protein